MLKKFSLKSACRRVKTPTILQMERLECGAAALGIILAYYGRFVSLPELRRRCGVSRDGVTALNLIKAAQFFAMKAKGFRQPMEALISATPPYIVYWQFCHFLVVEGFSKDQVFINDPMTGPRLITKEEFKENYAGVVLIIQPDQNFTKGGKKPNKFAGLYQRLRGSEKELFFCMLTNFLLVLPNMAIAVFVQIFIDNIFIEKQVNLIQPLLWGMGVIAVIQTVLIALQLNKLRYLQLRLSIAMTGQFFWHLLRLPVDFFAQRLAGEIKSRININPQLAGLLSGSLARSVIDGIMAIFYLGIMLFYDPVLTGISVFSVFVNIIVLRWVARQRTDLYSRINQSSGKISGVEISGLQNIETIKANSIESDFFAKWSGYYADLISIQQDMLKADLVIGSLPTFLNTISVALLLVIGGWRVMQGHLTLGMLIAIQGLTYRFQDPMAKLIGLGEQLQQIDGTLNRLDDVLQNPIDPLLETDLMQPNHEVKSFATPTNLYRLQGKIELHNVTFGYSLQPFIKNFSCCVHPGQKIALVGNSGCGKSTLAKLIAGLYQPWQGKILFDDLERSQIPRPVINNSLGMIEQEIFLFGGTIRDNLTLWDHSIPDTQILQACQDAMILDVIMAMPQGLNSKLLEQGANLSGGQRQRIEIARALVNNPSILIMDEATSALDTPTETQINRNLRRRGCTCVVVAHRLSTIRDCDQIIVLEQGQVIERGNHQELMSLEGYYYNLIQKN
jgi:ATP-binding cassette, subfamily C, bacterial